MTLYAMRGSWKALLSRALEWLAPALGSTQFTKLTQDAQHSDCGSSTALHFFLFYVNDIRSVQTHRILRGQICSCLVLETNSELGELSPENVFTSDWNVFTSSITKLAAHIQCCEVSKMSDSTLPTFSDSDYYNISDSRLHNLRWMNYGCRLWKRSELKLF